MENQELLQAMQTMITDVKNEMKEEFADIRNDIKEMKIDISGLKTDMQGVKVEISDIKTDIANLKSDMQEVKSDISDIKQEVVSINLRIENEIIPGISLMNEGRQLLLENQKDLKTAVKEMAETVLALDILHLKK